MKTVNIKYGGFESEQEVDESLYDAIYQQGKAEMLNEIIGMCKHGFIDKISLEFMSEQNEQKNE